MNGRPETKTIGLFVALFAVLLVFHLCHARILWAEEDLPLAAAQQMLFGKTLYRDIWFDKPPLVPLVCLIWGAKLGVPLRIAGAVYVWGCCLLCYLFARDAWGRRAGFIAAGLMACFLSFDAPSAVLPLAADLLMVLPHLAAVYLAFRGRPLWSGLCAGIGFLINVKATIVAAACCLFIWPNILLFLCGFLTPNLVCVFALLATGAWRPYLDQVWIWPAAYAASPHVADPLKNAAVRIVNWSGFHIALVIGAVAAVYSRVKWQWYVWGALSCGGVCIGARFFPRYFFQVLPPLVLLASAGFSRMPIRARLAASALLLVPLVRFAPRYAILAANLQPDWSDIAMTRDSRDAATLLQRAAVPNATLYVWGYRPDIFCYTRMRAASRYLDSQALTGVPADRHLYDSKPVALNTTAEARLELSKTEPDFVADGLSLFNPNLTMQRYPELRPWLAQYREFARTRYTILYRRAYR